jgi:hypothetical protein
VVGHTFSGSWDLRTLDAFLLRAFLHLPHDSFGNGSFASVTQTDSSFVLFMVPCSVDLPRHIRLGATVVAASEARFDHRIPYVDAITYDLDQPATILAAPVFGVYQHPI